MKRVLLVALICLLPSMIDIPIPTILPPTIIKYPIPQLEIPVSISAYNNLRSQTDDSPNIMANNQRVFHGAIALSRDLEKDFGLKFGDEIHLKDHGTYIFADRMNKRWTRKVDIFMWSYSKAISFGLQKGTILL